MSSSPMEAYGLAKQMPFWARMLGARWWNGDGSVRTKIGEVSYRFRGLAFEFGAYETPHLHVGLLFFAVFIPLPLWAMRLFPGSNLMERNGYGFTWRFSRELSGIFWRWGRRSGIIAMPWEGEHIRTEYLGVDLLWHDQRIEPSSWRKLADGEEGPEKWSEVHPYHYMLDNGEVQHVNATITRRRAYHGRLWFGPRKFRAWLRSVAPVRVYDSIDIAFDAEVGARRGSWKGGCVGTSTDLRPEESPRSALLRMQRERRFR